MVNREARTQLAEQLRHFIAGLITNDELCDSIESSTGDKALDSISNEVAFNFEGYYCKPYRLESLSRDDRRDMCRMILFLQSDHDYQWPTEWLCVTTILALCGVFWLALPKAFEWASLLTTSGIAVFLVGLLVGAVLAAAAAALVGAVVNRYYKWLFRKKGLDTAVWPFLNQENYEEALKHPKLLCGKGAT